MQYMLFFNQSSFKDVQANCQIDPTIKEIQQPPLCPRIPVSSYRPYCPHPVLYMQTPVAASLESNRLPPTGEKSALRNHKITRLDLKTFEMKERKRQVKTWQFFKGANQKVTIRKMLQRFSFLG